MARVSERFRWVWLLMTIVMGIGLLAGTGIIYTNSVERRVRTDIEQVERARVIERERVEREAQADFCELMRVFDDPAAPPPQTARGRAQQDGIRAYLRKRC
jgi:hypothetical protein